MATLRQRPACVSDLPRGVPLRHALLQYVTLSQFRSHLRRQKNLRPQTGQILNGSSCFLRTMNT